MGGRSDTDSNRFVSRDSVQHGMITGGDSGCRERGFKSCPQDRDAATVVGIELLLKGFAGARNQHYLQLWRPAA